MTKEFFNHIWRLALQTLTLVDVDWDVIDWRFVEASVLPVLMTVLIGPSLNGKKT